MVRNLVVVLALAVSIAPAAAQRSWSPELGIQGGVARLKPTGTGASDATDLWDLPGFGSGYGALFVVIPVRGRFAAEPSVSAFESSVGEPRIFFSSTTSATLGLRGDYAVTTKLYAAAGGSLAYFRSSGRHDAQLGLQAAVGFRTHIGDRLRGRAEALVMTLRQTEMSLPGNIYALLLGLSARLN